MSGRVLSVIILSILVPLFFIITSVKRYDQVKIKANVKDVYHVFANITNHFIFEDQLISVRFLSDRSVSFSVETGKIYKNERSNSSALKMFYRELSAKLEGDTQWSYAVEYEEYFTNLPKFMTNVNRGVYRFETYGNERECFSVHNTDYMFGFKIETQHHLIFVADGTQTLLKETIDYECPVALLPLCYLEVEAQRPKVLGRIKNWNYN